MDTLHEDQCTFMTKSCSDLLSVKNVSEKTAEENQNTYIVFNKFFLLKSCGFWDNVKHLLYSRAGHVCKNNTTHAFVMLDDKGYKNTLRINNIFFCLPTATKVPLIGLSYITRTFHVLVSTQTVMWSTY
jgi:hypothetical protein